MSVMRHSLTHLLPRRACHTSSPSSQRCTRALALKVERAKRNLHNRGHRLVGQKLRDRLFPCVRLISRSLLWHHVLAFKILVRPPRRSGLVERFGEKLITVFH